MNSMDEASDLEGSVSTTASSEETSETETALSSTTVQSPVAYKAMPADGNCPSAAARAEASVGSVPCSGFWLKRLNQSFAPWTYVSSMDVRGLFATDADLQEFVTAAGQGQAIVIGSIVIGSRVSIVIGSRSNIVIGSRNGIVIGSRNGIVIGSRDNVFVATKAYTASGVAGVSDQVVRLRGSSCRYSTSCPAPFESLALNSSTPSRAVASVVSTDREIGTTVTRALNYGEVVVSGRISGQTFTASQIFNPLGDWATTSPCGN
jgi:hypothetical protein